MHSNHIDLNINVYTFFASLSLIAVWGCAGRWLLTHCLVHLQMAGGQIKWHRRGHPAQRVSCRRSNDLLKYLTFSGRLMVEIYKA